MQRDMEYIYTVYKSGSFSKAAEILFASQPAVSMAVHRVEAELGQPLFDRSAHPLRLTEMGEVYIRHVERIRQSEETMQQDYALLKGASGELLRLGCCPLHTACFLPQILQEMHRSCPDVQISVVSAFPPQLQQMLNDREIDLALSTMSDTDNASLHYYPAFQVQYLLAVPADQPINQRLTDFALSAEDIIAGKHLEPNCPRVPLSLFARTPFITLTEGTDFYVQTRRIYAEADFAPEHPLLVSAPAAACDMARSGLGATLVCSITVDKDSPLVYYRLRSRLDERPFYFVLRGDAKATPAQLYFMEVCRAQWPK